VCLHCGQCRESLFLRLIYSTVQELAVDTVRYATIVAAHHVPVCVFAFSTSTSHAHSTVTGSGNTYHSGFPPRVHHVPLFQFGILPQEEEPPETHRPALLCEVCTSRRQLTNIRHRALQMVMTHCPRTGVAASLVVSCPHSMSV
jgi:hypothetical protein